MKILYWMLALLLAWPVLAAAERVEVPLGDSPALGPENAPVTMIEFIDFQ